MLIIIMLIWILNFKLHIFITTLWKIRTQYIIRATYLLIDNSLTLLGVLARCRHATKIQAYLIEPEWRIYASVNLPPLVQIMARRLEGAKPAPEPALTYCQLELWKQTSVKFES